MVFHRVALLKRNAKNTKNKDYKYLNIYTNCEELLVNELRCYNK